MGHTSDSWIAEQGVLDRQGGRVVYVQKADLPNASTTAYASAIELPAGAEIQRVYVDLGNAPTSATTIDVGISSNTDSIVDGLSLGTTDFRRVEASGANLLVNGLTIGDDPETLWVDFSRSDSGMRASLHVEYILQVPPVIEAD